MQIDKLIQLLESPTFIPLRLQLLETGSAMNPNLIKTLFGLLMLMPQSQAYKTLNDRLATASMLQMQLGWRGKNVSSTAPQGSKALTNDATTSDGTAARRDQNGKSTASSPQSASALVATSHKKAVVRLGQDEIEKSLSVFRDMRLRHIQ